MGMMPRDSSKPQIHKKLTCTAINNHPMVKKKVKIAKVKVDEIKINCA